MDHKRKFDRKAVNIGRSRYVALPSAFLGKDERDLEISYLSDGSLRVSKKRKGGDNEWSQKR